MSVTEDETVPLLFELGQELSYVETTTVRATGEVQLL